METVYVAGKIETGNPRTTVDTTNHFIIQLIIIVIVLINRSKYLFHMIRASTEMFK